MKDYVAPTLTVDAIIFRVDNGELEVLLINRKSDPFKGKWALPGGYCAAGDTTLGSLDDIVARKAGVHLGKLNHTEQLYTFDTVARDPRGHAVSVTYMGLGLNIEPSTSDSTEKPGFYPVNDLPPLVFDHQEIIQIARQRLASKSTYSNIVKALLPTNFTLTQLQNTYEIILDRELDKRNFRKKFQALGFIKETGKKTEGTAHRPAMLYKFKKKQITLLERNFE